MVLTTTVQLSEETQGKLFQLVVRLQSELGRRVSYDEAIAFLIMETQGKQEAREHFEKLFGSLRGKKRVWEDLRQLRRSEKILCRARNDKFALGAMETLEKTGFVKFHESTRLDHVAGMQKCTRKISLADCYVFALARDIRGAAVFANHEKDVSAELEANPPGFPVVFLEDLVTK